MTVFEAQIKQANRRLAELREAGTYTDEYWRLINEVARARRWIRASRESMGVEDGE